MDIGPFISHLRIYTRSVFLQPNLMSICDQTQIYNLLGLCYNSFSETVNVIPGNLFSRVKGHALPQKCYCCASGQHFSEIINKKVGVGYCPSHFRIPYPVTRTRILHPSLPSSVNKLSLCCPIDINVVHLEM